MDGLISVGIVHGSRLIRDGIGELLSRQPGVRVVGTFADGGDLLQQPLEDEHILLYDLGAARQDGPGVLKEVARRSCDVLWDRRLRGEAALLRRTC